MFQPGWFNSDDESGGVCWAGVLNGCVRQMCQAGVSGSVSGECVRQICQVDVSGEYVCVCIMGKLQESCESVLVTCSWWLTYYSLFVTDSLLQINWCHVISTSSWSVTSSSSWSVTFMIKSLFKQQYSVMYLWWCNLVMR